MLGFGAISSFAISEVATQATASVSVNLTGQSITSNRGTLTVDTNYVGYPVTAATAFTTTDSVYQGFILSPADGDRAYFPETVGGEPLVPELNGGNATGRISSGPQTGTFTFIYYRLFNNTYYDRQVTLVDGTVTNITLTGLQIQTNSGASFVRVDISKPITGQAITSGAGTLTTTSSVNVQLQSQSLNAIIVSLAGNPTVTTNTATSVPLTGQLITSSIGTVAGTGNASPVLTGQQISVGRGSITVEADASEISVPLTGLQITSGTSNIRSVGNVIPDYISYHQIEYVLRPGNV